MLMEGLGVMGCKRSGRGQACEPLRVQHLRSTGAVPVMGYLKNHLSSEDKQKLLGLIEDYRQGLLPLIVPLTLLKHHLNRYPVPDCPRALRGCPAQRRVHPQVYLHSYLKELMLCNHV
jgi:hypothetical protein